ncbi:MAG: hypothetical protein QXD43_04800 [Candidatus Aenigmatarchaeota archaeon]
MNFKEHRIEKKFNQENKNQQIYDILKDQLVKLSFLEEIPYQILLWLKIENIFLFKNIIEIENKIIELLNNTNSTDIKKAKKIIQKYIELLEIMHKFYSINKAKALNYLNWREHEILQKKY